MYMFDAFHTTGNAKRRPVINSLYEVFENIRDDEVCLSLSLLITPKPRVERYKSLCALHTSPLRNRFTFVRSVPLPHSG